MYAIIHVQEQDIWVYDDEAFIWQKKTAQSQTFGKFEKEKTYPKQIFLDFVFFFFFISVEKLLEIGIPSDFSHNCLIVCRANNIHNSETEGKKHISLSLLHHIGNEKLHRNIERTVYSFRYEVKV